MAEFDIESTFIPALYKPASELPIAQHRDGLLYSIKTYPVTIVVGQTGCGKTTQIPQFLRSIGWCANGHMIAVTQPRRVAAMTVAMRVAEEIGCEVGQEVGYSVRLDDQTSPATQIKYMTDGMLLREMLVDPLLEQYSVVMVDEAHERSISTDIALAMLKRAQQRRPELRIVVSSATLDAEHFHAYFSRGSDFIEKDPVDKPDILNPKPGDHCIAVQIQGREHPVDIHYLDNATEHYVKRAVEAVFDIHTRLPPGDILVFLAGREDIELALEEVSERHEDIVSNGLTLMPLPMYAGLTSDQQMFIFDKTPKDMRKVVFSTNIAEASVTIDGIAYVVDSGMVKLRVFDPATGMESLKKVATSKASAQQRAGRAGRTGPGKCFRLYPEPVHNKLTDATSPEIHRTDLAPVMLQLKALGVENIVRFDYVTPPPAAQAAAAVELLHCLGAIDDKIELTKPIGVHMAELPVAPMMARSLLAAHEKGCLDEMLTIAAMTSLGPGSVWFYQPDEEKKMKQARKRFAVLEGDHLTLYNAYQAFVTTGKQKAGFCKEHHLNHKSMQRAVRVRAQLVKNMESLGIRWTSTASDRPYLSTTTGMPPLKKQFVPLSNRFSSSSTSSTSASTPTSMPKEELVRRALVTGYFANAARMQPDGSFVSVRGGLTMWAHPSSLLFSGAMAKWVVYHEAVETKGKIYLREITPIHAWWLVEEAPSFYGVEGEHLEI